MSKPPVFVLKTGGFGPSGETRLHFLPGGKKIEVLPPSSRRQATVHRTAAFNLSSLAYERNKQKRHKAISAYLVRVFITYLMKSTGTNTHIQPYRRDIFVSIIKNEVLS